MSADILQFPDTTENKMRRGMASLGQIAVDVAGLAAYCRQREQGMSVDDLKLIRFMSWSDSRIDAVEKIYRQNKKVRQGGVS